MEGFIREDGTIRPIEHYDDTELRGKIQTNTDNISNLDSRVSELEEHGGVEDPTKADKVENATVGNLASLDANGNLQDSGKKASDFAPTNHTHANLLTMISLLEDRVSALEAGTNIKTIALRIPSGSRQSNEVYANWLVDGVKVLELKTDKAIRLEITGNGHYTPAPDESGGGDLGDETISVSLSKGNAVSVDVYSLIAAEFDHSVEWIDNVYVEAFTDTAVAEDTDVLVYVTSATNNSGTDN